MKVVIGILALFGLRWLWVYGTALWDFLRPQRNGRSVR